ncbi:MAG TPA: SurA N-terminal domain-containing protein [Rectinemataceae bacterium]|nr:SurA N-terminal domain-containing protein [Rectinemataceae bacterium]
MASQTPKAPAGRAVKSEADLPRRGIKNPWIYAGTIVVLAIVIVAFVFVPSVGGSAGGSGFSAIEFGRYDGMSIAYTPKSYFAQQVADLDNRLRQQGMTQENYQFFGFQVWRGAFERSVLRLAILEEMKKAGAIVTEGRLDERVSQLPQFQDNGKFSASLYHAASLEQKLQVRADLNDELLSQQYYSDVLGLTPSAKEVAFVKEMAKETRTIDYATFPLASFPDADVAAWAQGSAGLFRLLKLSRITLSTSEADAKKLAKQVQDKAITFEDAAKGRSTDSFASKGGEEGSLRFYELAADLAKKDDAEKVASLKKGELSPVLKTATGAWVFYRADEESSPADFKDAATLKTARDYMNRFERGKIEDFVAAKAKAFATEASAPKADFATAAKRAGAAAKAAGPFPLNYGDLSVALYGQVVPVFKTLNTQKAPELAAASTNEKFLTAAFSLAPGSVSEPIVLGDNIIVLKVKEAGSALDDATSGIELYYPYLFQQRLNVEVRDLVMKSPKLKDKFSDTYFKIFKPAQPGSAAQQ